MKILVTGGAGFIGSHIAQEFVAKGDEVVVVDNLSMGQLDNVPKGARFTELDITSETFTEFLLDERFDHINHHAAHMELRVSVEKPVHDATVNIIGSIRVLDGARRSGVQHVTLASSTAVLGEFHQLPATEEHPVQPIAPYGVSKRAMELYADYERLLHGMSVATLRYTNVYGPRQNPHGESGVIAIFLEKFLAGQVPTIHGDGSQERDYIHVSDVARANVIALEQRVQGTYHVCANVAASVLDVVAHLRSALASDCPVHHGPAKAGDPARTRGSHQAFTARTGWSPAIPLCDGISSTVAWFRERHETST